MASFASENFIGQLREFAQILKSQIDIVSHISKYEKLIKNGKAWQGPHSLHESQNNKCFSINVEQAFYHCYSCKEAGDIIGFETKRLNLTPFEAMKSLANDYNIPIPNFQGIDDLSLEERKKIDDDIATSARIKNLQEAYCKLASEALSNHDEALDYLEERGLTPNWIEEFQLGFGDEEIKKQLLQLSFSKDELISSGLFSDKIQILLDRIIIPTFDRQGKPCHFLGRSLPNGKDPKYLSQRSQQGQNPYAVHRTFWAYGNLGDKLEDKKTTKPLLIMEGSIDGLLAAQEYNDHFIVASANTTALSQEQITDMVSWLYPHSIKAPSDIIICNDTDSNRAGHEGAKKTIIDLQAACVEFVIRKQSLEDKNNILTPIEDLLSDPERIEAAFSFIPNIKMAILRKPPENDKIDLSDFILIGRAFEALYWIHNAITLDQYNQSLTNNPSRFIKANKQNSGGKLLPKLVANEIHYEGNYFINSGDELFWYQQGVYVSCKNTLRVTIGNKLGANVEPEHINKVYNLIEMMSHDVSLTVDYILGKDDPNRTWVNTNSGWLDFSKQPFINKPEPHNPYRATFAKIPIDYDPKSNCPIFEKFLREVLTPEDGDEFLKLLGYLPVRTLKYDKAFLFIGHGGNGKSTAIDVLHALLGSENCWYSSLDDIENDKFASSDLIGKLANFNTDLPPGYIPSKGVFKRISAGEVVKGERKYGDKLNFFPDCTLVFSANEIPRTNDTSYGYYRRWSFFAFDRKFSETADEDVDLSNKLTTPEELSGILNLAWIGYHNLEKEGGFKESDRSKVIKTEYKESNDVIAAFVNEAIIDTPASRVTRSDLYNFFKTYLDQKGTGREKISSIRFNKRFQQLKPNVKITSDRAWEDISLDQELVEELSASNDHDGIYLD